MQQQQEVAPIITTTTVATSIDHDTARVFQQAQYLLESAVASSAFQPSAVIRLAEFFNEGRFGQVFSCSLLTEQLPKVDIVIPPTLKSRLKPYLEGRRAACAKLVKLNLHPSGDTRRDLLRDYERELEAHSSICHPRVVQYLGAIALQRLPILGEVCGLVMEHVDTTLWDHLLVK